MAKILSEEFNVKDGKELKVVAGVNRVKVDVRDKKSEVSRRNTTLGVMGVIGTSV